MDKKELDIIRKEGQSKGRRKGRRRDYRKIEDYINKPTCIIIIGKQFP